MHDDNKQGIDQRSAVSSTQRLWSRRKLLRELGKAQGGMVGLLVLPSSWSKPLFEFASVGAITTLSTAPSSGASPTPTPTPTPCMTTALTLNLDSNVAANLKSTFNVYWWGAQANGTDCYAQLNVADSTILIQAQGYQSPIPLVNITGCSLASVQVSYDGLTFPFSAVNNTTVTVQFTTKSPARVYKNNPSENIALDFRFAINTQYAGYPSATITVSNPHSSGC